MNIRAGEVWLADLGMVAKTRPVLVVSREDNDMPRALVIHVPLTTQYRGSRYEVDLGKLRFLSQPSIANVQGITSIPITRLERKLGSISAAQLEQVRDALRFALSL